MLFRSITKRRFGANLIAKTTPSAEQQITFNPILNCNAASKARNKYSRDLKPIFLGVDIFFHVRTLRQHFSNQKNLLIISNRDRIHWTCCTCISIERGIQRIKCNAVRRSWSYAECIWSRWRLCQNWRHKRCRNRAQNSNRTGITIYR